MWWRRELVIHWIIAVNIVIDGNEPDFFLREKHFRVNTDLKVVSAEPAHVFDNDRSDLPCLHFFQQSIESRTVEVRSGISVICEVAESWETVLLCVFFKEPLLVQNTVGFTLQLIIS